MAKTEAVQQITEAFMHELRAAWPDICAARDAGDPGKAEELARIALENAVPDAMAIFERRIAKITNGEHQA